MREIKKLAPRQKKKEGFNLPKYLGHSHKFYGLSAPDKREIAKTWIRTHKDISTDELIEFLESLYRGESYEEKVLAGILLWSKICLCDGESGGSPSGKLGATYQAGQRA